MAVLKILCTVQVISAESSSRGKQQHTLSKEETRALGIGVLVAHLVELPGQHWRATKELEQDYERMEPGNKNKIVTTPTSVSGCLSTMEPNTLSQFGLP